MLNRGARTLYRRPGRHLPLVVAACGLLLALPQAASARENTAYRGTPEWAHVVVVWHVLLDHSQGSIYSLERFREVSPEVEGADRDLHALATRGMLSRALADGLVWVLRTRHDYVRDRCYITTLQTTRDEVEAARAASMWVVEMQLAMLREQPLSAQLDTKLRETVRASLVRELTFQRSLTSLLAPPAKEQPADKGGAAGKSEQKPDEAATAKRLQESLRRQRRLLAAYREGKLPRDRGVQGLVPYVMELSQTPPDRDLLAPAASPAP